MIRLGPEMDGMIQFFRSFLGGHSMCGVVIRADSKFITF